LRPLALMLLLTLTPPAFASPALAATGVPSLDFAEHMSSIEPAFAALEIERFLDLNPDHPLAESAREQLVSLYLAQKDWFKAQRQMQTLLAKAPAASKARWSLQLAHLQELKGWPDLARSEYERLATVPGVETPALRHLLGLEIRARHWDAAAQAAERLPSTPHSQALAVSLRAWRERPSLSAEHAQRLSTWLPGAGQIYAGDWGSGIASFTLNAAWVGLLSYAIADRDWLGGLLVANFGPRYYLGGIQNAGNLVDSKHSREDQTYIRSLEQEYADLFPLR